MLPILILRQIASYILILRKVFPILVPHIISYTNQIDTYLHRLSMDTGMEAYINDVYIEHDLDLRDETHADKAKVVRRNFVTRDYHSQSLEFENDIIKINEYLKTI